MTHFDVKQIRLDFPILDQQVDDQPLVYLDNAATTQKPNIVIDTISDFYKHTNANVHRGVYQLSEQATQQYETVRDQVQAFIKAKHRSEIIFTRGTTEAINLVAHCFALPQLQAGDEILISTLEHHSNIVPWQIVCEKAQAHLKVIPINEQGEILLDEFERLLTARTKLLAISHVSNSLGTILPIKNMIQLAHAKHIPVLVDGAQAIAHYSIDVSELDCDFYAFSSHKMYGPTGIGVLYGKQKFLQAMPPYQGGGDMIKKVTFEKTLYNDLPYKFEAGTPNIAGVIGLGAAIHYLQTIDLKQRQAHESHLLSYGEQILGSIPGLNIIGQAKQKTSIISFTLTGVHAHDIATILDKQGVAVRAGHHCTMPLMSRLGIHATARASFAFYNTLEEIDRLAAGIAKVREVFRL